MTMKVREVSRYRLRMESLVIVFLAMLPLFGAWGLSEPFEARAFCSEIPITYSLLADYAGGENKILTSDSKTEPESKPKVERKPVFSMGRFVTISVGTFPFAYLYTNFVFDMVRFTTNGFDTAYAPWPFNQASGSSVATSERFIRLGVAAGLCLGVGVLDIFLPGDW